VIPTCLKDGPFAGLYLLLYRLTKNMLEKTFELPLSFVSMASGLTAGMIATTTTHPFEIIRARMQVN
jgi:solute carrier family 25 protein 38